MSDIPLGLNDNNESDDALRWQQRSECCFTTSFQALMAHIQGVPIEHMSVFEETLPEGLFHTVGDIVVRPLPESPSVDLVLAHARIALAAGGAGEDAQKQALLVAAAVLIPHISSLALQVKSAGTPNTPMFVEIIDGLWEDLGLIFKHTYVTECADALAERLFERQTLPIPEVTNLISSMISEEQRDELRKECRRPPLLETN